MFLCESSKNMKLLSVTSYLRAFEETIHKEKDQEQKKIFTTSTKFPFVVFTSFSRSLSIAFS